jgi:hypothetical protein
MARAAVAGESLLPFDIPADMEYGDIRSRLQNSGKPIEQMTF